MCFSQNDGDPYFYNITEKYTRVSDEWNSFHYGVLVLFIFVIIMFWCEICSSGAELSVLFGTFNVPSTSAVCTIPMPERPVANCVPPQIDPVPCMPSTSQSQSNGLRRSLRLRRNVRDISAQRVDSHVSIHSAEQLYCKQWCERRERSRSKRRKRSSSKNKRKPKR